MCTYLKKIYKTNFSTDYQCQGAECDCDTNTSPEKIITEMPVRMTLLEEESSLEHSETTLLEFKQRISCPGVSCRPLTWRTTAKGDTRDFFRVLEESSDKD